MEEIKKPMTKTEIFAALAETTGLTKQQVGSLFDELSKLIGKNLGNDGPGTLRHPWPAANQGRPQARHGRTHGHQSLHQGRNAYQGQARQERRQGHGPEGPEGLGVAFVSGRFMGELSQRTIAKVSGPAWEPLRGQFMQISRLLLAVSPDADSELMTSYVKFTINTAPQSPVFAAVWFKKQQAVDRRLGLARGIRS